MKNQVIEMGMKNGVFILSLDADSDGQPSVRMKLNSKESLSEAFKRQEPILGAKVVSLKFTGTRLKLVLDTDKDGEPMLELEVDLIEMFQEII